MRAFRKHIKRSRDLLLKTFKQDKLFYSLLVGLFIVFILLRLWRIDQLLSFYYDQGRDALVISNILKGNLVLIGPTTGIEGLFLGPFYYYLLLPGYFLGAGNPVIASYWQTFLILLGYIVIAYFVKSNFSKITTLLTISLMTFSFFQIQDDRWLSNPTPTLLISPLVVLFLTLSFKRSLPFLPLATFCLGLMLQLEASSSFFLLILTTGFILTHLRDFKLKPTIISIGSFVATLIPQILFDLRHNFLLTHDFLQFIHGRGNGDTHSTFQIPTLDFLKDRLSFFADTFVGRLDLNHNKLFPFLFILLLLSFIFVSWKYWSRPAMKVMTIWFFGLLLCFVFYQGNFGRVYSYYLLPLMPIFFIFLGLILEFLWRRLVTKFVLAVIILLFLYNQLPLTLNYLSSGVDGLTTIALGNQTQAVKFVLADVSGGSFNVDVYVPPVIPYTYTYLFEYYGKKFHNTPLDQRVPTLYTIHEVDTENPKRESDWLKRQDGIGKVEKSTRFGGVGVEKRQRI